MSNEGANGADKINILPEDVDIIVRKDTSDSSIKVLDYKVLVPSGEILGFTTLHSHIKVNVQRSDKEEQETLNYFAKFLQEGGNRFLEELPLFEKEIDFYSTIVPHLTSNYDFKKWTSAFFLAKKKIIVLEDLKSQGYQVHHAMMDNYELVKSAVTTVANFHSCSILAEANLNRNAEQFIPLNERFPEALAETIFSETKFTKRWLEVGINAACEVASYIGKNPKDVREKFARIPDIIRPSEVHCNVILHSDLWRNNIMFDDANPLPNCILVDFQTTRYGPMVLDLLQLFHLNTSPSFRTKFEKELVDHYHSVLEETVGRNDPHARVPTREEIDLGLQQFRVFGILLSCLYFPVTMLDKKIITTLAGDQKKFDYIISIERSTLIFENFEKDAHYKAKVIEVITELTDIS